MKTLSLESKDVSLDTLIEMAARGTVIITQGSRPLFAVVPVDQEDLQTWQLGENPEFLALMRRSWKRLHTEGPVSLAEARQRLLGETIPKRSR